jgi:hypothetical protein
MGSFVFHSDPLTDHELWRSSGAGEPCAASPRSLSLRTWPKAGRGTLVIEASTNLAGWAPVFTNTTPTNVLFYTDPDASNYLRRFYRAFQFP